MSWNHQYVFGKPLKFFNQRNDFLNLILIPLNQLELVYHHPFLLNMFRFFLISHSFSSNLQC